MSTDRTVEQCNEIPPIIELLNTDQPPEKCCDDSPNKRRMDQDRNAWFKSLPFNQLDRFGSADNCDPMQKGWIVNPGGFI